MGIKPSKTEELALILAGVRAKDDAAFARLVELYQPLLKKQSNLFKRDGFGYDDAYSVAQYALYCAALRYNIEQTEVTFGWYVTRCIVNAFVKEYHRDQKSPVTVPLEEEQTLTVSFDRMEEQESFEELLAVIRGELSELEYSVFTAVYIENIPYAEIAESLGRDEKSVRNASTRSLGKLREKLGRK